MHAIEIAVLENTYHVGFLRKKEKIALNPLNLSVDAGEVFGFLGPNGAGKTTTLKLLMGLIYPTGGSARILGEDWREPGMKARIGFLPEQPYFYDYLTATELLDYLARLSGVAEPERKRRIPEMLERVGLADAARVQLRKFSKGMLQRVGIAQAIVHDPEIVFLDEPTSGLDPLGRREVRELIHDLKKEGKTVFFSTHILSDAEALCDRVAIIHKGELRGVGTVANLISRVSGSVEVIWRGNLMLREMSELGGECRVSGDISRAVLAEEKLDSAIDLLRRARVRLVSVTPVRSTLEDFFMQQLGTMQDDEPARAIAGEATR
jgi:ABC-2 type transport system ATP-binding protein